MKWVLNLIAAAGLSMFLVSEGSAHGKPGRGGAQSGGVSGKVSTAPNSGSKVIAAPNGNTGITGAGLPPSRPHGKLFWTRPHHPNGKKVIAAPNGNTGITGAGLPKPSGQSGIGIFRNMTAAPSVSPQFQKSKLAGGVPMQKTQQGLLGEIGGVLIDGAKEIGGALNDAIGITLPVVGTGPPKGGSAPPPPVSGNNKVALKPVGKGKENAPSRRSEGNLVALKPVGKGNENAPSRKPGAGNTIDVGFEAGKGGPVVSGPIGNGQGAPPAPAPAPPSTPGGASPGTPGGTPPVSPLPSPGPVQGIPRPVPVPSIPVMNSPVILGRPAEVRSAQPVQSGVRGAPSVDLSSLTPIDDQPALQELSIDLVLEDVSLAAPATLVAGPAYRVKGRNQGLQAAGPFQVAILAGLKAKLSDVAPRTIVELPGLRAGESFDLTLRLPVSSMRMIAGAESRPIPFTHLFVAVDFLNSVPESDETNNLAIIRRADLEAPGE